MAESVARLTSEERKRRLEAVLAEIARRFGLAAVYPLRQARPDRTARAVPTGSVSLDRATGIGGIPRGRLTELSGPPSCGKRTLVAHIVAHAFSADRLHRCGASLQDLLLAVPETGAEALAMVELLAQSAGLDAIILDALPFASCLMPSCSGTLLLARVLWRIVTALRDAPPAAVFVQEAPGFDSRARSGSRALPHAAAMRLLLRPEAPLLDRSGLVCGLRVRAEILANKLALPSPPATFELDDRAGIRRSVEVLDAARAAGLIAQHPLGLLAGEVLLGRNRAQAAARLAAEPALRAHLEGQLGAPRLP